MGRPQRQTIDTERLRQRRAASRRSLQELVFSPWILLPAVLVVAAFLSQQFFQIQPRYIKLIVGLVLLITVARLPLDRSLTLFMVIFPVPTFVFIGDTNVLFIGLLLVVWTARRGLGMAAAPMRSPIDWAIFAYLAAHLLSFINVESAENVRRGLQVMGWMTAGPVLYFLLYNCIRTEGQLLRILQALCALSFFVDVTVLVEYYGNGYKLVPEWYLWRGGMTVSGRERVGGIFGFHGLLADFSAIMFYLQALLAIRARTWRARAWYLGLCVLGLVNLALAVNRGGVLAWVLGGGYFFFLARRDIDWRKIALASPALALVYAAVEMSTGSFFTRMRVLGRISGTQLQGGVPENRVAVWSDILRRVPEHLWIGHGPFYELGGVGVNRLQWPHSGYLFYLYTVGVFGLATWVWILLKLTWKTLPRRPIQFARGPLAPAVVALAHVQILMFAAAQFRDSHQRGNVYLYVMWILFALAAISLRIAQEQRARRPRRAPGSDGGDEGGAGHKGGEPPASGTTPQGLDPDFRPSWYHRAP